MVSTPGDLSAQVTFVIFIFCINWKIKVILQEKAWRAGRNRDWPNEMIDSKLALRIDKVVLENVSL